MPYPAAFDEQGDIRYMMRFRPRGYGFFPVANDRFIVMERQTLLPTQLIPHSTQMYEMDYLGRVYRTYYVPNGIHHDVCEMTPGGNLLVASNSQCGHVEDCIAEVNRETGKIEKVLDMREIFGTAYRDRTNWVHINSLDYDSSKKQVYFSARNIHTIGCIDWKKDKLKWILGEKNMWKERPFSKKLLSTPENMPWHFQQHSAKLIRQNLDGREDTIHIMIFDNHWHVRRKNKFFDNDEQSYVTIYTINEKKKKAWIEKRFGGIKSKITSNGILCAEKRRLFYMGGFLAYPENYDNRGGYIYEFDYDTGCALNEYSLRYYFFRAYELRMNMQDLSKAMDLYEEPCVGWLQPFERWEEPVSRPEKKDIGGTDTMQAGENPTSFRRSESPDKIQRSFDRAGCRKGQAEYVSKKISVIRRESRILPPKWNIMCQFRYTICQTIRMKYTFVLVENCTTVERHLQSTAGDRRSK